MRFDSFKFPITLDLSAVICYSYNGSTLSIFAEKNKKFLQVIVGISYVNFPVQSFWRLFNVTVIVKRGLQISQAHVTLKQLSKI